MPDQLRRLPDHVTATLLRALMVIPHRPASRLILKRVTVKRVPYHEIDYQVLWRGQDVGRIDLDPEPYPAHLPWRWFMDDHARKRGADGRSETLEEAMIAFRAAWDQVPDNARENSVFTGRIRI